VNDDQLIFTVKNNYKSSKGREQFHQSLGLINLKKRLELFYSGRHSLDIYDDSVNYHVTLTIVDPFNQGHHVQQLMEETVLTETEAVV
jgi:sensor histidine kinase YesM